jgi:hypothetical protein
MPSWVASTSSVVDDAAMLHHRHPVGDLGHDAEIMGDEEHPHAAVGWTASPASRICAWMVTSSAVVGSSAISSEGLAGERHRDHHALALAAGQLVRIGASAPGRRECAISSSSTRARRSASGRPVWTAQDLVDLLADRASAG